MNYEVFRKKLQEYEYPDEAIENNGSRNMKCFIDAANNKYEVVNNEGFSDYFFPTTFGEILGMIFISTLANGLNDSLNYCLNIQYNPSLPVLKFTAIIGAIAGGAADYKLRDTPVKHFLEQKSFIDAAHECYDNIHKPIGEIATPEVEVHR